MPDNRVDVLIVGAGLSGIGAAYRLQQRCPGLSYAILEAREAIGGTWDLFRYPGIRSDSDVFTLAYPFRPWRGENSIVDGTSIREYVEDTARDNGIDRHIRFGRRVVRAAWSSEHACWTADVDAGTEGARETWTANFLYFCSGYYDYGNGYLPEFAGIESFDGHVVHPQFWPEDLDYAGKKVVVIGSGATAVTLVPSMAGTAEHVTMLQRSPSYVLALPWTDALGDAIRKVLPAQRAHTLVRAKNTLLQVGFYQLCRRAPRLTKKLLRLGAVKATGSESLVDTHFTPTYEPWDQRLCIAPGGDLFQSISDGTASVVTDKIERFVGDGVQLQSGEVVDADIIVTATGLSLQLLGGAQLVVDGVEIEGGARYAYRGLMLSGVPNFAMCIGYINLSWTMRADMTSRYVCKLLNHIYDNGYASATPKEPMSISEKPLLELKSGYVQRTLHLLPKQGSDHPWTMRQNFLVDAWATDRGDVRTDMEFAKATE